MTSTYTSRLPIQKFDLWNHIKEEHLPLTFDLEVTARCNNNCRHCYINLPASDRIATRDELSLDEIENISEQARDLGVLWCLITGGEPLLREDFQEIYLRIRNRGILTSVFTNACLIREEHIDLFHKYPPRTLEVTVYGVSEKTYERVTRRKGSYRAFRKGLDLLLENEIPVNLKAMALRSNIHEFPEISAFCRKYTKDTFRFDPVLHFRYDRNQERNRDIAQERLTPGEIASLEQADPARSSALKEKCDILILPESENSDHYLFRCNPGRSSFSISSNGLFRLCSSLCHPDCVYDLRKGSLADAFQSFVPRIRGLKSTRPEFLQKCDSCGLLNLCLWCPAHAYLETGELDAWCNYFCDVAHARVRALRNSLPDSGNRD